MLFQQLQKTYTQKYTLIQQASYLFQPFRSSLGRYSTRKNTTLASIVFFFVKYLPEDCKNGPKN